MSIRSRFALLLVLFMAALPAAPLFSQVAPPPVRSSVDKNGVNLIDYTFTATAADLTIGPQNSTGLSYQRYWSNSSFWTSNLVGTITNSTASPVVTIGRSSEGFSQSGANYIANEPTGSTLQYSAGQFVYTTRDGTVAKFTPVSGVAYIYSAVNAVISSVTRPNGLITNYTYQNISWPYCTYYLPQGGCYSWAYSNQIRLQSVNNNVGFQLKLTYVYDRGTSYAISANWPEIYRVTAINNAIEYCDPSASTCSLSQPWNYVEYDNSYWNSRTNGVTDSAGNGWSYSYDSYHYYLTGIKRNGRSVNDVTVGVNTTGGVTSVARNGQTWTYTYGSDSSSNPIITTVTDPLSHSTIYRFGTNRRLGIFTDEGSHTTSYSYYNPTGKAQLQTITMPEGDVVTYVYDARDNVQSTTRSPKPGFGVSATISTSAVYPASCTNAVLCNKPTSTTDERGQVTSYSYDPTHGGLTSVTSPTTFAGVHPQTRYGYTALYARYKNSAGALVQAATSIYLPTTVSACQVTASCTGTADEARTTIAYEAGSSSVKSNLLPVTVSNGSGASPSTSVMMRGYDSFGNVTSIDGPLSGSTDTTRIYYNSARQPIGTVGPDPDGAGTLQPRAVRVTYRSDGLVSKIDQGTVTNATDNPSGLTILQTVTSGYDSYSRPIRQALSASATTYAVTDTSYDALGRPSCAAQRMNMASLPADACTLATAGAGGPDRITHNVYNFDGSISKVQTAYNVTTANGFPATLQRDEVTNTYTANGKISTRADGKGNLTTYEYDAYDRLVKTRFPKPSGGGSSTTDYELLTLDNGGNVTDRRLRDGRHIVMSYDNLGRLTARDIPNDFTYATDTSYTYDNLGRMLTATASVGSVVTSFAYDALGQKTSEGNNYHGTTTFAYDAGGRRARTTWKDGFYVTYDYDALGEMTAIRENGAASGIGVLATFAYDNLGRRISLTRGNGTTTSYGYDPASRLSSLVQDIGGTSNDLTLGFTYNSAGQITSSTRSNDAFAWTDHYNVNRGYTANGLNQYTATGSITPTYDGLGNLTSAGSTTYNYSADNQLLRAAGVNVAAHDGLGRMYWDNEPVSFAYDGSQMIAELSYTSGNPIARRYVFGPGSDEPLVWYEGSGTTDRRWLHADERGSIIALSSPTGGGTLRNSYDEYGIPQSTNQGRFQYTGQAWLPGLGMYYYKARLYSPTLGRFLQTDPIGYGDGMNMYNYVHGDPVNMIDPSGLQNPWDGASVLHGFAHVPTGPSTHNWSDINLGNSLQSSGDSAISEDNPSFPGCSSDECRQWVSEWAQRWQDTPEIPKPVPTSRLGCLWSAGLENKVGIGLDLLGIAANFAFPEGSAAVAVAGLTIGTVGIAAAAIDNDGPADAVVTGTIAYAGKQAAAAEGLFQGARSALAHDIGIYALGASIANDARKIASDYNKCLIGE